MNGWAGSQESENSKEAKSRARSEGLQPDQHKNEEFDRQDIWPAVLYQSGSNITSRLAALLFVNYRIFQTFNVWLFKMEKIKAHKAKWWKQIGLEHWSTGSTIATLQDYKKAQFAFHVLFDLNRHIDRTVFMQIVIHTLEPRFLLSNEHQEDCEAGKITFCAPPLFLVSSHLLQHKDDCSDSGFYWLTCPIYNFKIDLR